MKEVRAMARHHSIHCPSCAATNGTSRRGFLKSVLGLSSLVAAGSGVPSFLIRAAMAAEEKRRSSDHILVVVQLAGGNDGLNTVVPFGHDEYYRHRPSLCVGRSEERRVGKECRL